MSPQVRPGGAGRSPAGAGRRKAPARRAERAADHRAGVCEHRGAPEPTVFLEWGPAGAAALAEHCRSVVVVDVLSFSTSASIACGRGSLILPSSGGEEAAELARRSGAVLARGRREATPAHPWTLSPAVLLAAPVVPRLVLPSPNGSAICRLLVGRAQPVHLLVAALRNRAATASLLLAAMPRPIGVVPAGERWPDGSLRPALEDLLGAALVIERLSEGGERLSVGAETASRVTAGLEAPAVVTLLEGSLSAAELTRAGCAGDVLLAGELDVDAAVVWEGEGLVANEEPLV